MRLPPGPTSDDRARHFETRNIGRARRRRIAAAPLHRVRPIDARRRDFDQNLARQRNRPRAARPARALQARQTSRSRSRSSAVPQRGLGRGRLEHERRQRDRQSPSAIVNTAVSGHAASIVASATSATAIRTSTIDQRRQPARRRSLAEVPPVDLFGEDEMAAQHAADRRADAERDEQRHGRRQS